LGISIDTWPISTENQLEIHPNAKTRHPREICGLNTYSVSAKTAKLFAVHFDVDAAEGYLTLHLGDAHFRSVNIEKLDLNRWYSIALTWCEDNNP
jgi:hypothetical protein